jgi:carboxyl-terminal processing protease
VPAQTTQRTGRRRSAWVRDLIAVLAIAAGCLWLGGHPSHLPAFLRDAFVESSKDRAVSEALSLIEHDYFRKLDGGALVSASISGAVASLDDPFSHYLTPAEYKQFARPNTFSGVGLEAVGNPQGLLIERVFSYSPAERAGLKPGDLIVAVNGRSLRGVPAETARNMIRGPAGTTVELTIEEGSRQRTVTLMRQVIDEPSVYFQLKHYKGKPIGWILLAEFTAGCAQEVREAVVTLEREGAQGLVLDLRHDGGGLVKEAQLIASTFLPKGALVVTMRSRIAPPLVLRAVGGELAVGLPMAVLVDRDTASAAEILTAALKDNHRAVVVGTHTYGKGVFQELFPLSNGGGLDLTVGEYFTPNGHNLGGGGVREGAGITPEIPLSPAVVDTDQGLEAALAAVAKGR